MRVIDLTHTFAEPMPFWPGDPAPRLSPAGEFDGCPLYEVTTGMHVGTHLDAPAHMLRGGTMLADISPERFIGRGVLIDVRGEARIGAEVLAHTSLQPGDIVLLFTGFSAHFGAAEYYADYPEVTPELAAALIAARVSMLGLDSPSPDRAPFPIHRQLFAAGILLLENLTKLEELLGVASFEVIALPVKFRAEAAPTRVVARLPGFTR